MQKSLQLRENNITQFLIAWMPINEMNFTQEEVLNLVRSENNIQLAITDKSLNLEKELENEERECFEYDENKNLKENLRKFKEKIGILYHSQFESSDNLRNLTKIIFLMLNNAKNQILLLICMKIYFNSWKNENEYDNLTKLFINQWEDLKEYIDYFVQLEIKPQKNPSLLNTTIFSQPSNIIYPPIVIPSKINYPKFIMKHR